MKPLCQNPDIGIAAEQYGALKSGFNNHMLLIGEVGLAHSTHPCQSV